MKNNVEKDSIFSQKELEAALQVWESAAITIIDIRYRFLSEEERVKGYTLPASTFIYTRGQKAEISLNGDFYDMEHFGIFHGGKGTEVSIDPLEDWLETYMVLYKAGEPPFSRQEFGRKLEGINPFQQQYGFQPENPFLFGELLRKMYEGWKKPVALHRFYGKAVFYQMVYEVYQELYKGNIRVLLPDVTAMAKEYIEKYYREPISIRNVASMLGISDSHLRRNFKSRYGSSLQEYMMSLRLQQAKRLLQNTTVPIRSVAIASGFSDEFSFSKLFYKKAGMSPREYRANIPINISDSTMDNMGYFFYNEESLVSLGKLKKRGEHTMFKQFTNKTVIAAALSIMLILSACNTLPADTKESESTSSQSVTVETSETEVSKPIEEETRTITTVMGDVEVPTEPKRVVAEAYWVGDLLALGNTPIAIQEFYTGQELFADQLSNTEFLDSWEPEAILSFEPDLIISRYEEDFEELSKIAPTVIVPWDVEDSERLPFLAQVLGKEAEDGEAILGSYDQLIQESKEKLSEAGLLNQGITIMHDNGDGTVMIQLSAWAGGAVYQDLGMKMPDKVKELAEENPGNGGVGVSLEVVSQYVEDVILFVDNHGNTDNSNSIMETEIWNSIPAVREENVVVINNDHMFFTDMTTKTAKLNKVVDSLLTISEE